MVRIPENTDWVIFTLLGAAFVYVFMFVYLNREIPLLRFLTQGIEDSSNVFLNWVVISMVLVTLSAVLLSQYVPVVPDFISERQLLGYELNKFGFVFFTLSLFYLIRAAVSYVYFYAVGQGKKWRYFYFIAQKFYFVTTLGLMVLVSAHFFLDIDRNLALPYYAGVLIFFLIFKALIYSFAP